MGYRVSFRNAYWDLSVNVTRQHGCCGMVVLDGLGVEQRPNNPTDRGKKAAFRGLQREVAEYCTTDNNYGSATTTSVTPEGLSNPRMAFWNAAYRHEEEFSLYDFAIACDWKEVGRSKSLSTGNQIVMFYQDFTDGEGNRRTDL
jgi:hypothetical protein